VEASRIKFIGKVELKALHRLSRVLGGSVQVELPQAVEPRLSQVYHNEKIWSYSTFSTRFTPSPARPLAFELTASSASKFRVSQCVCLFV